MGRETPGEAVEALTDTVGDRLRLMPGQECADIGCSCGAPLDGWRRHAGLASPALRFPPSRPATPPHSASPHQEAAWLSVLRLLALMLAGGRSATCCSRSAVKGASSH